MSVPPTNALVWAFVKNAKVRIKRDSKYFIVRTYIFLR